MAESHCNLLGYNFTKETNMGELDEDLQKTTNIEELRLEIIRLRNGIRKHRDQQGDDRCWLDDIELYKLLPDNISFITDLPAKDKFLKNCERFWETRQCQKIQKLHEW